MHVLIVGTWVYGRAAHGWNHSVENRRKTDFTNHTGLCMNVS